MAAINTTNATLSAAARQYADLFGQCREALRSHSPQLMDALRDDAYAHFCRQGLPTRRQERYRYTDIEQMLAPDYGLNVNRLDIPVDPYEAFRCDVPNLSTSLYFMVNDAFYAKALPKSHLPEGMEVGSLAAFADSHPDIMASRYGRLADVATDSLTALNTMLAQDGLVVYVPRGVKADRCVQIINILRSDVDLMVNRRVLIVVEAGAEAKLLFCDHAADDRRFLTTQVIEAYVGEGASLDLYCLEETHARNARISNLYARLDAGARINHNMITLHNGTTRNSATVELAGEGASCQMGGLAIADKEQHVDNNTLIDHLAPGCESHELYKYVLDGKATGAFAGRVLVRQGSQKTVSEMRNQNLCATRQARMFTQPMLEIYADDVQCSHGSTVGQLNDAALFYMQQRGLPLAEARLLLQAAFVCEVIDQMELAPLRDRLHHLVDKRFRGELSKCAGCKLCK